MYLLVVIDQWKPGPTLPNISPPLCAVKVGFL